MGVCKLMEVAHVIDTTIKTVAARAGWALCLLAAVGCGDSTIKTVPVGGNVTIGGSEPFANGTVVFVPVAGEGTKALGGSAITDENGHFVLKHAANAGSGIEPGDYKVVFSLFLMPNGDPVPEAETPADVKTPEELGAVQFVPPEYANMNSDKNKVTVESSGGEFDFDIPELKTPE